MSIKEKEEEIVKRYVNEKIESLNSEISKFKLENERVKKIRRKYEDLLKEITKEKEEFEKKKSKEIEEFEAWKNEETKKIKREKKISERQNKVLASMPNRKEREEIENLKKIVKKLEDDCKFKDQRGKLTNDRLKKQLDESNSKNKELIEQLKIYEQNRIQNKENYSKNKQNFSSQQIFSNKK